MNDKEWDEHRRTVIQEEIDRLIEDKQEAEREYHIAILRSSNLADQINALSAKILNINQKIDQLCTRKEWYS